MTNQQPIPGEIILAEAQLLHALLDKRGIKAGIATDSAGIVEYFVTPSFVVYKLSVAHSQKLSAIEPHTEDFASWLHRFRVDNDLYQSPDDDDTQRTSVRLDAHEQALQVSRPWVDVLHLADINWHPRPHQALLGQASQMNGVYPVKWILAKPEQSNVLLAGQTGSGKTLQLVQILSSLAENNGPDDLAIWFVDAKPSADFARIELLPHVEHVARNEADGLALVQRFQDEMQRRYDWGIANASKNYGKRIVLAIEELATLYEGTLGKKFEPLLSDIARRCREAGMNLLLVTQKPHSDILPSQLTSNLNVRLAGRVVSKDDSHTILKVKAGGAEALPGRGSFIAGKGGRLVVYQAPYIEDPNRLFASIAQRWGGYEPVAQPVMGGGEPVMGGGEPVAQPVIGGYGGGYNQHNQQNTPKTSQNSVFAQPLKNFRPLRNLERAEVRRMALDSAFQYRGEPSRNKLCIAVYGSKDDKRLRQIDEALAGTLAPMSQPQADTQPSLQSRPHMRVLPRAAGA